MKGLQTGCNGKEAEGLSRQALPSHYTVPGLEPVLGFLTGPLEQVVQRPQEPVSQDLGQRLGLRPGGYCLLDWRLPWNQWN